MDPWTHVDPRSGDFAPPGVDPESGRPPPSRVASGLSAGITLAVISLASVSVWAEHYAAALLAIPFVAGTVVGALSLRRPLRSFLWIAALLFVASALWALALGGYAIFAFLYVPLPLPGLGIGILCGHTLRRSARAWKRGLALRSLEAGS